MHGYHSAVVTWAPASIGIDDARAPLRWRITHLRVVIQSNGMPQIE